MYIKNALILLLLLIPFFSFSQIEICDVADWKSKVDSAIMLIKERDTMRYNILIQNCKRIDFIIGDFSSTQPPSTIVISVKDMKLNSINNIACVLVHESYHLYLYNNKIKLDNRTEEVICYIWEYDFLCNLTYVEDWLFKNTIKQIIYYTD
jgi:hypothetical protein